MILCLLALAALPPPCCVRVFLIAGQSNAVGSNTDAAPAVINGDRISVFGNNWVLHHPALEPIDSPFNQLHLVSLDATPAIGPGMYFADQLVALCNYSRVVLVPAAKGATRAVDWMPLGGNIASPYTYLRLYGSAVLRAAFAQSFGKIAGILYLQGESDALSTTDANAWGARTTTIFASVRVDLNQEKLPIVYSKLPPNAPTAGGYLWPGWQTVRDQQQQIASAINIIVPQTVADPTGHLTAAQQAVWGRAAADAFVGAMACP